MDTPTEINYKVAFFGAGFVGLPTSSVLALHNPQIEFIIYDINKQRIQGCKNGVMPIYQPQLKEIIQKVNGKNLNFSKDFNQAVDNASIIFLTLPTPTKNFGEDNGKAYDLSYTQNAIDSIVNYYNCNPKKMAEQVILVQKSTVPIGTARMIQKKIQSMSIAENRNKYIVASNPEFLAEGTAIADLMKPDRIVIGLPSNVKADKLIKMYHFSQKNIITTSQYSSELSKLAANCFLAQRVSSINSMAIICENFNADISEIKACIGSDSRIGDKFINSSIGFGGSCFQKDILALIYLAESKGLQEVADYWSAVIKMNNYRKRTFFIRIFKQLNSNLKGKSIAIFGTAFKKDTCDARESPAIDICSLILEENAILRIYDPKTSMDTFIREMEYNNKWNKQYKRNMIECQNAEQACKGSSAIVILTEWDQFRDLDYGKIASMMKLPLYIFDGRNIIDEQKVKKFGFNVCKIGKAFNASIM